MTTSTAHVLATTTVTTRQDLVRLWSALVGADGFDRRTLWLVLLDDDGRPAPAVVPVDDVPLAPSAADVASFAQLLGHLEGCGTPVLLLSRPGPPVVQVHDRQWGRALTPCAPRWPVHLATLDAGGRGLVVPLPGPGDEPEPSRQG